MGGELGEALVPEEELKYIAIILLEKEPGPSPKDALLFLGCFSFVSDQQLFEFSWNSEKVKEVG